MAAQGPVNKEGISPGAGKGKPYRSPSPAQALAGLPREQARLARASIKEQGNEEGDDYDISSGSAGAGLVADPLTGLKDRGLPAAGKQQTACPVVGGKINKDLYVDYKGQRTYFCCKECIDIFKKDPEKYLKKMEREGVTPEKAPAGN